MTDVHVVLLREDFTRGHRVLVFPLLITPEIMGSALIAQRTLDANFLYTFRYQFRFYVPRGRSRGSRRPPWGGTQTSQFPSNTMP